jgi:hypothetical protein
MKVKKEYLILILIIIGLSAYLLMRTSGRTLYQLPELAGLKQGEITKIEISQGGNSFTLKKKDDQWYFEPAGFLADRTKVNAMLNVFEALTLTALVSETEDYNRYDLQAEKRITVKAWQQATLKRNFDIGKAASSFRHTFVRLDGDSRVFHARDNFRDRFVLSATALRDKQVGDFTPGQIASIVVTLNDHTFNWVAIDNKPTDDTADQPPVERQWETNAKKELDHAKINRLLETLAALNCQSYLEPGDPAVSNTAVWTIQLNEADTTHTFTLFPSITRNETTFWPATSSTVSDPFLISDWQAKDFREIMDQLTLPAESETGTNASKDKS